MKGRLGYPGLLSYVHTMKKFSVTIYVPSVQIYTGTVEAENEEEAAAKALEAEWVEGSDDYTVEEDYNKDDEVEVIVEDFEE
jgi:hypothetical protein